MLYIGWGDGGWRGDPHNNGQNPMTMLGSMLRIDVNGRSGGRDYAIPQDNPFVRREDGLAEVWAYGLRNPWKYSFAPDGRLIVADVGQDEYEEIDIISRGGNYGWNIREGRHCYRPSSGCRTNELIDPVYEYSHEEGQSVTGGYVYTGERISDLKGRYIFGDFVQGRVWALDLADKNSAMQAEVYTLGKWPLMISTFGRDHDGELYVADFAGGAIYRMER
jgi:glucose/arabinose dehydrogenase